MAWQAGVCMLLVVKPLTGCGKCRGVVTLKNVSSAKCSTAAEAMDILRQVATSELGAAR